MTCESSSDERWTVPCGFQSSDQASSASTLWSSSLAPVKGSSYREPDYTPSATGHLELQPLMCGTVCRPLSLQPAHSRLSKDNWKLFFSRTHFLSFSSILIMYRVLEAFSLNATLIFTFNDNNKLPVSTLTDGLQCNQLKLTTSELQQL